MKYIEVDGIRVTVHTCNDCPFYADDSDDNPICKHPVCSTVDSWRGAVGMCYYREGAHIIGGVACPLREQEEKEVNE